MMLKTIIAIAAVCASIAYFSSTRTLASDIEINGILLDANGGVALINDSMVGVGDTVQGAKVVKITREGVAFVREGQEFFQGVKEPSPYNDPKTAGSQPASRPASQPQSTRSQSSSSSASTSNAPMKTLYGMPINKFFPDKETLKKEIEDSMPVSNPIVALHKAQELKDKAEERRKETEQRVKEMEEGK